MSRASQPLHGGLIDNGTLYLCAIQQGELQAFDWPQVQENSTAVPRQVFSPKLTGDRWKNSDQKTRGLALVDDRLICGVCYFGKPKPGQAPPRMVEFDRQRAMQVKEHRLPTFQGLEDPHIYALLPVPSELEEAIDARNEPLFFRGENRFSPIWKAEDAPVDKLNRISVAESSDRIHPEKAGGSPVPAGKKTDIDRKKSQPDSPASVGITESMIVDSLVIEHNRGSTCTACHSPPTVIFQDVGLCFERTARTLFSFNRSLRRKNRFWALRDVSFTVYEGETVGVIGRNGSGKSTLSMICSGVLVPDMGTVTVNGRTQLLALGVGFKNELSGRENVFISGSLMGLSKKEIKARMEDIEAFSELGAFIDEPVRTYSSGMRSRLGFAVATAVRPDILILDEIMATGDKAFRDKAMRRMREMRDLARSVIVVSHNPAQLRKLSQRVLWLEKGRVMMIGEPRPVLNAYDQFCQSPEKWLKNNPNEVFRSERESD